MNLDQDGFAYWSQTLPENLVTAFGLAITSAQEQLGRTVFRDAFTALPSLYTAVRHPALSQATRYACAAAAVLQRALVFDKSCKDNWTLRWHQDRTIAVRERHDVAGYTEWSEKDGVPHVHPPAHVLDAVLVIRIHIDDVDETNGALELLHGTHPGGDQVNWAVRGADSPTTPSCRLRESWRHSSDAPTPPTSVKTVSLASIQEDNSA
ncbi:MAG: phytanoyl-CoA dioxygenase family protein [Proteobacteria bacterium]|nr:phytanoyl-CoA dioxygenase family protein [Pseudomonadota bacterium]